MAIAFVANQNDNFTDVVSTQVLAYGSNNTAGNLLVAFVDILDVIPAEIPPVFTITDSNGNLWEKAIRLDPPIGDQTDTRCAALYYVRGKNTVSGANTVTLSTLGVTYNMGLAILEFSGLDPNNPLSTVSSYGYSSTVATQVKNPKLPALRTDYPSTLTVIAVAAEDANPTVGTGWTDADDNNHLQVSYKISTTAGYLVPNWVTGTSNYYGGIAVTFHAGPAVVANPKTARSRVYSFPQLPLIRKPRLKLGIVPAAAPGIAATVAQSLSGLRSSATVAESLSVTAAPRLLGLRSSATVGEAQAVTVAQRIAGLRSSASVQDSNNATVAQRVGALRSSATVGESDPVTVAQRLGGLRSSASAGEAQSVTVAQRLAGLRSSASVGESNGATVSQRLGGLRSSAAVAETDPATAAMRLGGLRSAATVGEGVGATVAQRLGQLRSSATVSDSASIIIVTVAQRVGQLRSVASGGESLPASVALRVAGLRSSATVMMPIDATISCRVGGLRSSATVTDGAPTSGPLRLSPSSAPLLRCTTSSAPLLDLTITTGPPMLSVFPGQSVRFSLITQVLGVDTTPSGTSTLTLYPPNGATDSPIVDASPVVDSAGNLHSDQVIPVGATPGIWAEDWLAQGASPSQCGRSRRLFEVKPLRV